MEISINEFASTHRHTQSAHANHIILLERQIIIFYLLFVVCIANKNMQLQCFVFGVRHFVPKKRD